MTNLNIDLRLLSNRKQIEVSLLQSKQLNEYEHRSALININWKYEVVIEALKGLYDLRIEHCCNLKELVDSFEAIAPSKR